ncbi:hypothetical protein NQ317_004797 [Molorchus minor]|uniref:Malic enzyme n=1 Tax=Molorchus minor TaxID=1323400 RepID=A0ABQ9JU30_9CUCU|nr:hypothetical protein NQ317_004797 [Molorchus minor]
MFALIPRSVISRSTVAGPKAVLTEALKVFKLDETSKRNVVTGDVISPSFVMGIDHLRDPRLNKGLGFTLQERQALGIHGLQPARFKTQEEQLELCRISVERYQEDLNKPEPNVKAVVVTDGERILGLGDLGACGMGIPVGKLALYTALAGIKPSECLPIVLDVGTNNQKLLEDPLYVGLRQKRTVGKLYDDFVDEFMQGIVKRYGQNTLIQFEDFGNHNAFRLLSRYRENYCTFNDDIQGTASVTVSGLYASERVTGKKVSDHVYLFLGAGEAAIGIADLTVKAMEAEGLSLQEARDRIWMVDINGLLVVDRQDGGLDEHQKPYAKKHEPMTEFATIVDKVKPSVLIGAAAATGAFKPEILKAMATFNERPLIFALSNPTPKAECTAEQAYVNTDGRCIFSSGSPFGKVVLGDKTFYPGQGNNAYIFPGVSLGVLHAGIHHISEHIFLIASHTVAKHVSDEDLAKGSLYPPLSSIKDCSMQIACNILEHAYQERIASVYPKPKHMREYVESQQYNYNYEPSLPPTWQWPNPPYIKTKPMEPTKLKA